MDDEIIYNCLGISKKDIKDAIAQGCTTLAQIQEKTGAGSVCGACIDDLETYIHELLD